MPATNWKPVIVEEVMHREVRRTDPDMCLSDVARKMRDLDVGCLPVLEDDEVVGIITDRDIACRAIAETCDLATTTVQEIMTRDVASCFEDQEVGDAARIMRRRKVRRLPVLDHHNHLVGMLTLSDLSINAPELSGGIVRDLIPHR